MWNDKSAGEKMRIVQELVPGKQITLAHVIANPDRSVYEKMGLESAAMAGQSAIGVMSLSPAEITVIAADIATKSADVQLAFLDYTSGTLLFTGAVSSVEASMEAILRYLQNKLEISVCEITRT